MKRIYDKEVVHNAMQAFVNEEVYLHLETTNGAYASHFNDKMMTVGAFIRNVRITFERGSIAGTDPYRVGLKLNGGWVYAEGITHYEKDEKGRLLLAGHNDKGQLAVALQLSKTPF
ncbi:YojF family protein [Ectobacillus antri]|uniref:YojF family protein n=1 Tax=Ectobacillus antri TaxID=2486280 RepID=A0ABT6H3Y1_9BACI|nr:YojF family protein [Ectobacillus antri]MDG4656950.1 YojF family protein [Ectobacillus antri]MDG5754052.1 YojF family protein [Ectobacillus antri]